MDLLESIVEKEGSTMNTTTIGIDLAKNVFQLHGVDALGKTVFTKWLSRAKLLPFLAKLSPCLIAIEVCSGANYWSRRLRELGHEVRQMSPQFVKPYAKINKNDYNDAQALCVAVARPEMRFVFLQQARISVQPHGGLDSPNRGLGVTSQHTGMAERQAQLPRSRLA